MSEQESWIVVCWPTETLGGLSEPRFVGPWVHQGDAALWASSMSAGNRAWRYEVRHLQAVPR